MSRVDWFNKDFLWVTVKDEGELVRAEWTFFFLIKRRDAILILDRYETLYRITPNGHWRIDKTWRSEGCGSKLPQPDVPQRIIDKAKLLLNEKIKEAIVVNQRAKKDHLCQNCDQPYACFSQSENKTTCSEFVDKIIKESL